jgi:hypothetical protein
MMPKSEHKARLAMRAAHKADHMRKSTNRATASWQNGAIADTAKRFGDRSRFQDWNSIEDGKALSAMTVKNRIRQGANISRAPGLEDV